MSDSLNPNLDRRTFIRGAATAVGATAIAGSGIASNLALTAPVISVAYFDGKRLIPIDRMPAADRTLRRVEVTLQGFGKGKMRRITANFPVRTPKGVKPHPFHAWSTGGFTSKFEMPVDSKNGLSLSVAQGTAKAETATALTLGVGSAKGAKLREGMYIIAAGPVNWASYRFEADDVNGPLLAAGGRPTSLQYTVLTIGRV